MKYINKVELQGTAGIVKRTPVAGTGYNTVAFNLATNSVFRDKSETIVIDTTWHTISVLEKRAGELDWMHTGSQVHVTGRLRVVPYLDSIGGERTVVEIVAEDIRNLNEE